MAWVRFTADFDFKATPQSTIAYKAGMKLNVPQRCASIAVLARKAARLKKTSKDSEAQPWPEPTEQDNSIAA